MLEMDPATGALTPRDVVRTTANPSWLALDRTRTHLYSANEVAAAETGAGTVSAYSIDRTTGRLTLLNTVSSEGAGPAHMSIHPAGKHALVANYGGGTVAVLPIQPDGRLGAASDVKRHQGATGAGAGVQRASRELCDQRPRSPARAHDRERRVGTIRVRRRSGARPDLRLEIRRREGHADPERSAVGRAASGRRPAAFRLSSEGPLVLLPAGRSLDGGDLRLRRRERPAQRETDDLDVAARVCRHQLHVRDRRVA